MALWDEPFYSRMPDPIAWVEYKGYRLPIVRVPSELLSPGLQGRAITLYALCAFYAKPNGKRIPLEEMFEDADERGLLKGKRAFVEPTSGGTGAALGHLVVPLGFEAVAVVADGMIKGKLDALRRQKVTILRESEAVRLLGLTKSPGSIELARIYAERFDAVFLNQYKNEANPRGWRKVAIQVWEMLGDQLTDAYFVLGSCGTLNGFAPYFKERNPDIRIVAAMPFGTQDIAGTRSLERLEHVLPWKNLVDYYDETDYRVASSLSYDLWSMAGIPGGDSSGLGVGIADHDYSKLKVSGKRVGFMVFMDTFVPYRRGERN